MTRRDQPNKADRAYLFYLQKLEAWAIADRLGVTLSRAHMLIHEGRKRAQTAEPEAAT